MTDKAHRAGMIALALAIFPACEVTEPDPVGPDQLDLAALIEVVDSVNARLESVTFALDKVAEVSDVLARDGADLDVLREGAGAAASPGLAPEEIPQALHGAVYVRNPSTHEYERDPERTDGPADGIRIVHYLRLSSGELLIPLAEAGSVDVTQEAPAEERFGIALRNADGGVPLEFIVEGEDTQEARARDVGGTVDGDPPLTFSLASRHEAFQGGNVASLEGTLQAADLAGLYVRWDRYQQDESGGAEAFQEGGFSFELNGDGGYASAFVQFASAADGSEEIEGHMDFGAGGLAVSGTLTAPMFGAADGGGDLSSADRALVEQLWADLTAFVDAWWVPIGT